jgi:D-alanyl-D-alanine endopeptidase (penicillin-binding protein 7)
VNRKSVFWVGHLALAGLVCIGVTPADAAAAARKKTTKAATSRPAYSAARAQSRKAKLAQARAVAMAREMADTAVPRFKVDASGDLVPELHAAAAIIYDPLTNQILWEENGLSQRSIASITKVMTATVFLENNPDVTQPVTIERSDVFQASTTHLIRNDKVTVDDLLHLVLIASDNAAARALARVSPRGRTASFAG